MIVNSSNLCEMMRNSCNIYSRCCSSNRFLLTHAIDREQQRDGGNRHEETPYRPLVNKQLKRQQRHNLQAVIMALIILILPYNIKEISTTTSVMFDAVDDIETTTAIGTTEPMLVYDDEQLTTQQQQVEDHQYEFDLLVRTTTEMIDSNINIDSNQRDNKTMEIFLINSIQDENIDMMEKNQIDKIVIRTDKNIVSIVDDNNENIGNIDVNNEILETLNEQIDIKRSPNFASSSVGNSVNPIDNLEESIRNSVKSEIEHEQNFESSPVLDILKEIPEREIHEILREDLSINNQILQNEIDQLLKNHDTEKQEVVTKNDDLEIVTNAKIEYNEDNKKSDVRESRKLLLKNKGAVYEKNFNTFKDYDLKSAETIFTTENEDVTDFMVTTEYLTTTLATDIANMNDLFIESTYTTNTNMNYDTTDILSFVLNESLTTTAIYFDENQTWSIIEEQDLQPNNLDETTITPDNTEHMIIKKILGNTIKQEVISNQSMDIWVSTKYEDDEYLDKNKEKEMLIMAQQQHEELVKEDTDINYGLINNNRNGIQNLAIQVSGYKIDYDNERIHRNLEHKKIVEQNENDDNNKSFTDTLTISDMKNGDDQEKIINSETMAYSNINNYFTDLPTITTSKFQHIKSHSGNAKGSRAINNAFTDMPTFNQDIGRALPVTDHDSSNRSAIIIVVSLGIVFLFILVSVTIFLISFQRQHGTLDIEMQERNCGKDNLNEDDSETFSKLLEIELPNSTVCVEPDENEGEKEKCL